MPVAPDRESADVQLDEPPTRKLERARVARDDRKAKSRLDRVLDRPVRSELHRDHQLRPRLARGLLERQPAARGRFAHDERLAGEVFQVEAFLAGQRVPGGRHHHELVGEKGDDRELRVLERRSDHGQVQLAAQDLFLHPLPRPDL